MLYHVLTLLDCSGNCFSSKGWLLEVDLDWGTGCVQHTFVYTCCFKYTPAYTHQLLLFASDFKQMPLNFRIMLCDSWCVFMSRGKWYIVIFHCWFVCTHCCRVLSLNSLCCILRSNDSWCAQLWLSSRMCTLFVSCRLKRDQITVSICAD